MNLEFRAVVEAVDTYLEVRRKQMVLKARRLDKIT